jgi:hypothetical protein
VSRWQSLDLVPLFWLAVIALTWPFLLVRLGSKPTLQDVVNFFDPSPLPFPANQSRTAQSPAATAAAPMVKLPAAGSLFGRTAIVRSLVLFNALNELCFLCASRRLPADRDRAVGRGLRVGGHAAWNQHRAFPPGPRPGFFVDRSKRAARALVDASPRSTMSIRSPNCVAPPLSGFANAYVFGRVPFLAH